MLTTLFYVLCILAIVHFIYEKIILPSIRLSFRNQLFALRDKVRKEIIKGDLGADLAPAQLVHDGLNNAINRLHLMTLPNKIRAQRRMQSNPAIQARIKREVQQLKNCKNKDVIDVMMESGFILEKTMIFNNLMFLIYILPVALSILFIVKVVKTATGIFAQLRSPALEEAIMLLPDQQVREVVYA